MTNDLDTGTTYLVVVKYSFNPGVDNDSVSLYVFSEGNSIGTEPSTPTIGPLAGTASDMTYGQYVALRQYNASQRVTVDGIIAQTSWNISSIVAGGIESNQALPFAIYPNPAQDRITVRWNKEAYGPQRLTIINSLGQRAYQKTLEAGIENESTIALPQLSSGVYSVVIEGSGKSTRVPLVISN